MDAQQIFRCKQCLKQLTKLQENMQKNQQEDIFLNQQISLMGHLGLHQVQDDFWIYNLKTQYQNHLYNFKIIIRKKLHNGFYMIENFCPVKDEQQNFFLVEQIKSRIYQTQCEQYLQFIESLDEPQQEKKIDYSIWPLYQLYSQRFDEDFQQGLLYSETFEILPQIKVFDFIGVIQQIDIFDNFFKLKVRKFDQYYNQITVLIFNEDFDNDDKILNMLKTKNIIKFGKLKGRLNYKFNITFKSKQDISQIQPKEIKIQKEYRLQQTNIIDIPINVINRKIYRIVCKITHICYISFKLYCKICQKTLNLCVNEDHQGFFEIYGLVKVQDGTGEAQVTLKDIDQNIQFFKLSMQQLQSMKKYLTNLKNNGYNSEFTMKNKFDDDEYMVDEIIFDLYYHINHQIFENNLNVQPFCNVKKEADPDEIVFVNGEIYQDQSTLCLKVKKFNKMDYDQESEDIQNLIII